jgi:hypothetical protein
MSAIVFYCVAQVVYLVCSNPIIIKFVKINKTNIILKIKIEFIYLFILSKKIVYITKNFLLINISIELF